MGISAFRYHQIHQKALCRHHLTAFQLRFVCSLSRIQTVEHMPVSSSVNASLEAFAAWAFLIAAMLPDSLSSSHAAGCIPGLSDDTNDLQACCWQYVCAAAMLNCMLSHTVRQTLRASPSCKPLKSHQMSIHGSALNSGTISI